jgi:hypothetical protein
MRFDRVDSLSMPRYLRHRMGKRKRLMLSLFGKLKTYAIAALAAIGAILFALVYGYTKGSKAGSAKVIAISSQATIQAVETRNTVDAQVAKQPDGASAKILKGKWSRD